MTQNFGTGRAGARFCALSAAVLVCVGAAACGGESETGAGGSGASGDGGRGEGGVGGEPSMGGAGGDGGAGQGAAGGGGAGGDGGGPPNTTCDYELGWPIGSECGVFVDPAAVGGDGTQSAPFGSLAEALASRGPSRFYVCNSGMNEAVTLEAGDQVYGAINCNGWAWNGTRTLWVADPGSPPVTVLGGAVETVVAGFTIAASANPTGVGAELSAVGIVAENAQVRLERVDIESGDGAHGADGANGANAPGYPADAGNGTAGAAGSGVVAGPAGGTSTCGRAGGAGGGLTINTSFQQVYLNGSSGQVGSLGGVANGSPITCRGEVGNPGTPGANGASGNTLGTVSLLGFVGASGTPGISATHGNGGGGGGANGPPGYTGGSGGGGGCSGEGGAGGTAGGASLAIISIESSWSFSEVTLSVGVGGDGGNGGAPGAFTLGGMAAGTLASPYCRGGHGGAGAASGAGGSGAGGHAVAVLFQGDPPNLAGVEVTPPTVPGAGGSGAVDGTAAVSLELP